MVPFTFGSSDGRSINGTTQRIAAGTVIKPIGARAVGKVVNDDRADWREAWALFAGDPGLFVVWHALQDLRQDLLAVHAAWPATVKA